MNQTEIKHFKQNIMNNNYNIAVLPGDGIGPEIIREALKVLKTIGKKYNHNFTFNYGIVGGIAIDECGNPYPEETHQLCEKSDAILFGAIGDPKYDNNPAAKVRPEQGLLKMRKSLGLFANLRPVEPFDCLLSKSPLKEERIKGANLMIVRELTGGLYFGEPRGRAENGNTAFDTCLYTREEIERVSRIAFDAALKRNGVVHLVDKANVLATSRLWREVVTDIYEKEYKPKYGDKLKLEYMFVDNAAMQLVTAPILFDVILTENLFGDILSDEASVITGSIGLLPSASVGNKVSLYEPIHGSFPQGAGKNIANPIATILSAAMMLQLSFSLTKESDEIKWACKECIEQNIVTPDLCEEGMTKYTTEDVGNFICELIENKR